MKQVVLTSASLCLLLAGTALAGETVFPSKLVSHVVVPGNTIISAPADAPEHLKTSGKFTTPDRKRAEGLGTIMGKDGHRETGLALPFNGQPLQGFSGIKRMEDGTFWTLSDNGFGSKINSSDAMLMIHHVGFDWDAGAMEVKETVFLSDPDKKAPFPIAMEGAGSRYLTGADFDVESIQPVADGFWIGEEFGPYMLKFSRDGKLTDVIATKAGDIEVKSPDNPTLVVPANPTAGMPSFNLRRSGGYEGLAISKDGTKLYAMLEGPLYKQDGTVEMADSMTALRIIELDATSKNWTGRTWMYPLTEGGVAIGDFNMIDDTTALVIERDNGAGTPDKACADPKAPTADCFANPAKHKRIYKIEMTDENTGQSVRKIGYIDLMKIEDPDSRKRQGGGEGFYDMPFVTIENVDIVDETHIIVGNDNNLPYSAGRSLNAVDDNEFVLLEVGEFLAAK